MATSCQTNQPTAPIIIKQTFSVRLPVDSKKKYSVLKFNPANNVDFTKCDGAKIERENNLKDFKSAYDIDSLPKFGAGSEFGREQREEARKKKFGVRIRKYNSEEQPWLLKLNNGPGKPLRRFKGVREGGVAENASFYIFMQCSDNKTFEAIPVDEWYNFTPQVKYKYLDTDEAEQEYSKRDKTLNYFNIMLRKRLKNDETGDDVGDSEEAGEVGKKKSKKSKTDKSLTLSEFDEWSNSSDDDDDDDDDDERKDKDGKNGDSKSKQKRAGKSRKKESHAQKKKKKKKAEGSDDEAVEESDEADEGEEVDYMSGSSSDDEQMYDDKDRDESEKYQDKGVEDEEGLRKLVDSGDEEEEEEEKKDDENEEDEDSRLRDDKAKDSNSESSSDSDSDSDPEKDANFSSALFMTEKRQQSVVKSEAAGNRPSTPSNNSTTVSPAAATVGSSSSLTADIISKVKKRKAEIQSTSQTVVKKSKTETITTTTSATTLLPSTSTCSGEGITEEAVRRYLMRKPMMTKDLVQKFKSRNAGMSKEQMTTTIAHILKRLNPQKKTIKDKMYLFLDKVG